MRNFESSQKDESKAQSADSSKVRCKPRTFNCSHVFNLQPCVQFAITEKRIGTSWSIIYFVWQFRAGVLICTAFTFYSSYLCRHAYFRTLSTSNLVVCGFSDYFNPSMLLNLLF